MKANLVYVLVHTACAVFSHNVKKSVYAKEK